MHKKIIEEAFFPIVVIINTIPVVAKAPILVLLLGNGMEPKIAIAALICFFPTLVNMVRGLEAVNPQAMELMRVLSAIQDRGLLQAAAVQFAAVSVLGAEDLRIDFGHRRDRRRVDRLHQRHRRADHPGDLRLQFSASLRHGDRRLLLLRCCSSWSSRWPNGSWCAGRPASRPLTSIQDNRSRREGPMIELDRIEEQPGTAEVVARTDVVVVGRRPGGFCRRPRRAPRKAAR